MDEQGNYGIPYAMHIYDISELVSCDNVSAANKHLKDGDKLLSINTQGNQEYGMDAIFIFGVPRSKYCTGWDNSHKSTRKHYDHQTKQWYCPVDGCDKFNPATLEEVAEIEADYIAETNAQPPE